MSEEEKEAIEELKKYEDWNCFYNTGYLYKAVPLDNKYQQAIQTGLNYINKLQKENKKQKEDINKLINYIAVRESKDYEDVRREFEIEL